MQLRVTVIGLALAAVGACGGGEEGEAQVQGNDRAEIDALVEEIESLEAQHVEELERVAVLVEGRGEAYVREWTRRADRLRTAAEQTAAQLRDAAARDAWDEVFLLGASEWTPMEMLQDMKTRAEENLARARERRLAVEEQAAAESGR